MTEQTLSRRSLLQSACRHCLGFTGLTGVLSANAQSPATPQASNATTAMPQRFVRPAIETEEGGLWGMMDREEAKLRRSPFIIRDAMLTKYIEGIVCRLSADHCMDIRVHIVRTPLSNASMAPNGMMQVWSGLLLRVENEAQLAAVLGHEIGHYLERHTFERIRDLKSKTAVAQFMGAFGVIGALAQLGVLASIPAFSRDQENSADRLGMRLMQNAGYEGQQSAKVWDNLIAELKVKGGADAGTSSPFMASHPPLATRRDDLLKLAGDKTGHVGTTEFQRVAAQHRMGWLQDEIKRGQYEESLILLDRLIAQNKTDPQILYTRGEVYRMRAGPGDYKMSVDDLNGASALENPPAEASRSLGLAYIKQENSALARQSFEKYLAAMPDAPDANLIKNYIAELKP